MPQLPGKSLDTPSPCVPLGLLERENHQQECAQRGASVICLGFGSAVSLSGAYERGSPHISPESPFVSLANKGSVPEFLLRRKSFPIESICGSHDCYRS